MGEAAVVSGDEGFPLMSRSGFHAFESRRAVSPG
jgi:hypothetical protein